MKPTRYFRPHGPARWDWPSPGRPPLPPLPPPGRPPGPWWPDQQWPWPDDMTQGGGWMGEAPLDGRFYGRRNRAWDVVVGEAPADGRAYARQDGAWQALMAGAGGFTEAPEDGQMYGRRDAAWALVGGGVVVGATAPADPQAGDLWWDTSADPPLMMLWTGTGWTATTRGPEPLGVSWTMRGSPADALDMNVAAVGMAYGNGVYVSGVSRYIYRSSDGINWQLLPVPTTQTNGGVTFGNGVFVLLSGTAAYTSPDGIAWTQQAIPANNWQGIAFGNGVFVAVANTGTTDRIVTSTDGIAWAPTSPPAIAYFGIETDAAGTFVARAGNSVATSTDNGANWTQYALAPMANSSWLTYGNGQFMACNAPLTNNVATSPDGVTWTVATVAGISPSRIVWGNGEYLLAVGNILYSSPDLITVNNIGLSASNNSGAFHFVNGAFFFAPVPAGLTRYVSPTNWTTAEANPTNGWSAVAYGAGRYVALAATGINVRAMTSTDGLGWTRLPSLPPGSPRTEGRWSGICYGGGRFVAVADRNAAPQTDQVMTSPDGLTWTRRTAVSGQWKAIAYGGGRYVAVGFGNAIMTSPDGTAWTAQAGPAGPTGNWNAVAYGNGRFVAVSQTTADPAMVSSDGGVTWMTAAYPAGGSLDGIAYGAGVFVAVGANNWVYVSSDGLTWQQAGVSLSTWGAIAYGRDGFVAARSPYPGNQIMTSADGIGWTTRAFDSGNNLTAIAYGDHQFVVVATSGVGNRVATSP